MTNESNPCDQCGSQGHLGIDHPPRKPTVFEALIAVRRAVGHVSKDSRNQQGSGYNFRGIDAIVNASTIPLLDNGVNIVPECVVAHEQVDVKSGSKRTDMAATRLVIRFRVYGPAGDSFPIEAAGEAYDSGDKATPKASSVAWRTALLQALHIPTDEPDPDSFTYDRNDQARQVQEPQGPSSQRERAYWATDGAGDQGARMALLARLLAQLDPPVTDPGSLPADSPAWTAVATKLELEGFPVPADPPAPEPQSQDAGPGFPVSAPYQVEPQGERF